MEEVIIIGAGLSGLTTAYNLKKKNINVKILEAQNRIGGRIETIYGNQNTAMEMGATWFAAEHKNLIELLAELNIGFFEQHNEGIALFETMSFEPPQQYFVPANEHSAYRVQGGTYSIIEALYKAIGDEAVVLNTGITEIVDEGDHIKITDSLQNNFLCKQLVVAMPPKLLANTIQFVPALPQNINQVMQNTQTWMSGSAKFSIEYKNAFWKENGFSGSVYSQSGLATEIYDHSNFDKTKFALKGFLNGSAIHYTFQERKEKVLTQLSHYFGNEAQDFVSYNDKIWNDKFIQPVTDTFLPPHFNNGHAIFNERYMNNKLFFTGTETSKLFSGYMEGAIIASNAVTAKVLEFINK
jgi:monoamine oxidase